MVENDDFTRNKIWENGDFTIKDDGSWGTQASKTGSYTWFIVRKVGSIVGGFMVDTSNWVQYIYIYLNIFQYRGTTSSNPYAFLGWGDIIGKHPITVDIIPVEMGM